MSLRIVLDTNVLLVSVSSKSPYYWLYEALLEERYEMLVSTAILLEYEEIIGRMMSRKAASDVMGLLIESPNVLWVDPHFQWQLIEADREDDKFVDCAIAGGADCIVTYDQHFDVLETIPFPRVSAITPEMFKHMLSQAG